MRRPVALLAAAVLVCAFWLVPASPAGAAATPGSYARTIDVLNIRSGPSTAYPIRLAMPCGARPYVLSGPYNGTWYRVSYGSTVGYSNGAYLTRKLARTVTRLPTSSKVVALTFDAGSDAGYATLILDTLRTKGVRASFSLTGTWTRAYPSVARRIAPTHVLVNHSYSHPSFTGYSTGAPPLSYSKRRYQVQAARSTIVSLTGRSPRPYFRPPFGDYNTCVLAHLNALGYSYNLMWSIDSGGWRGLTKSQIIQRVLSLVAPGAIVVLHVGSASQDGPALASLIDQLRGRGYSFATIASYYG